MGSIISYLSQNEYVVISPSLIISSDYESEKIDMSVDDIASEYGFCCLIDIFSGFKQKINGMETPSKVIKELETRSIELIKKLDNGMDVDILDYMEKGNYEFERRTGRKMSYGESRATWG
jgi:hypothetical protein